MATRREEILFRLVTHVVIASLLISADRVDAREVTQLCEARQVGGARGSIRRLSRCQRLLLVRDAMEGLLGIAYTLVVNAPALLPR